ncbi:class I SAM-dependent methyltransferase [Bradyrhizobium sp. WSM2254]|uniref:class I SAM-dependent methyltransferase n=1 Tax=Bradyrhizobium sp. WSM2254 TaxID=1188263 RepID=UPI00042896B8|nr:class I SAM-dependent methyltransferase [Bradyrhizobium sp. WSM2254]
MSAPEPIKFTDGVAYERFMAPWSRSAGALFLDWLAPGSGLTWVDVGCGNGAFTELILATSAPSSVCAIDPSDAQIATARAKLSAKQVELSIGDAMALPYDANRFDVAVMALALFFVPDAHKGAAEMVRVTRPGGMVASYTWDIVRGGSPTQPLWEEMDTLGKPAQRPPSTDVSRFEALKSLWAELGLREVETRELVVERTFANFDDYWLSMVVSSPAGVLARLSETESAELMRRLRARLPASASGEITVHASATAIKGRKAAR